MEIEIKETRKIPKDQLLGLYRLNKWSSAEKPELLFKALTNSHTLISAWINGKLVLDKQVGRPAVPNQDVLTVPFQKGENTVLMKIDQIGGGWGFYFSVMEGEELMK